MQRDAGDRVLVDLEDEVVAEVLLDRAAGALHELVGFGPLLGQQLDRAHVLLLGRADLLVLVRVNQRAEALVRKHFGEQPLVQRAVDDVNALHAALPAAGRTAPSSSMSGGNPALSCSSSFEIVHEHLPNELSAVDQTLLAVTKTNFTALNSSATATATWSELTR